MEYICDAYGKNDDVYPKDVVLRAQVHARLFFDATTLYPKAATAYVRVTLKVVVLYT